ncbi:hypothetical protein ABDJ41_08205 [Pedobacter sp. ASV1-7]|uniref:hypothetical protein n=1 Tax=Pedobacter sp. ASV1-7 TaxID=3145237 RepID=UPI0032E88E24
MLGLLLCSFVANLSTHAQSRFPTLEVNETFKVTVDETEKGIVAKLNEPKSSSYRELEITTFEGKEWLKIKYKMSAVFMDIESHQKPLVSNTQELKFPLKNLQ